MQAFQRNILVLPSRKSVTNILYSQNGVLHLTVACRPGYVSQGGKTCEKCPQGTYKTSVGREPCQACPVTADGEPQITPADGTSNPKQCQGNNQIYSSSQVMVI